MEPPERDQADRRPIWDALQDVWMDTELAFVLPGMAEVCAASKYSIEELEQIYWNEVRPAVKFNLWDLPAPEWAGFELEGLTRLILAKHRFGRRLPTAWLRPHARACWREIRAAILERRAGRPSAGQGS
jgi:hypothetical protein